MDGGNKSFIFEQLIISFKTNRKKGKRKGENIV